MRLPLITLALASCAATPSECPIPGATPADHLILPGETHFAHLWQVTFGGENAEAYWSFDGTRLCMQVRNEESGWDCDRICVTEGDGSVDQLSNGRGVTTCSYFMPDGQSVIFASTHAEHETCPPPADRSQGYVWQIHPEYDIYRHAFGSGDEPFVAGPGYDAEATVCRVTGAIVFTSVRDGDLELYTMEADGSNVKRITNRPGYDGGAFFSHDGQKLVLRSGFPEDDAAVENYQTLLAQGYVMPSRMEITVCDVDGSNFRQVTDNGKANFAPYWHPDNDRILFSSSMGDETGRNFDIYMVRADGTDLEQITTSPVFDGFPMFSPDGRYVVFASNRYGKERGDTNIFVAEWVE